MNFEQARFNMVEQQVRTWEVLDQRVLDVVGRVPRDRFVPADYRRLAYADTEIPLGHGEHMMPPRVEARMLQALQPHPGERVLEIGTGSGYVTALLAALGAHVTSVEIVPELHASSGRNLSAEGVEGLHLVEGDGLHGWQEGAPWDCIAVTGSLPVLDPALQQQLAIGGRLFVIVGQEPAMEAFAITRVGEQEFGRESLFETVIPPLRGAVAPQRFVL